MNNRFDKENYNEQYNSHNIDSIDSGVGPSPISM